MGVLARASAATPGDAGRTLARGDVICNAAMHQAFFELGRLSARPFVVNQDLLREITKLMGGVVRADIVGAAVWVAPSRSFDLSLDADKAFGSDVDVFVVQGLATWRPEI